MKMPSFADFLKAIVIALLLGIIAFLIRPVLGLEQTAGPNAFLIGLIAGALLGAVIMCIKFAAVTAKEAGEIRSIFVGNLAFKASQEELRNLFSPFGEVRSVRIMTDRATRRPRGFGFVEMDRKAADKAIKALDGTEFHGRKLRVNIGSERKPRPE